MWGIDEKHGCRDPTFGRYVQDAAARFRADAKIIGHNHQRSRRCHDGFSPGPGNTDGVFPCQDRRRPMSHATGARISTSPANVKPSGW
jgi:hypothetical protein